MSVGQSDYVTLGVHIMTQSWTGIIDSTSTTLANPERPYDWIILCVYENTPISTPQTIFDSSVTNTVMQLCNTSPDFRSALLGKPTIKLLLNFDLCGLVRWECLGFLWYFMAIRLRCPISTLTNSDTLSGYGICNMKFEVEDL